MKKKKMKKKLKKLQKQIGKIKWAVNDQGEAIDSITDLLRDIMRDNGLIIEDK